MGWMRIAGFVFVFGLVAACNLDATTPNQCQADDQCREGAYCDVGRALCVTACEKAGCLEGHFCDPSAHTCGAECPFGCTAPENATAICSAECGYYNCNPGSHLCVDRCPLNTDASACGTSCTPCAVPENGTATCNDDACGMACNPGYHVDGVTCAPDTETHCGASDEDCTASRGVTGTVTGMICKEGACFQNQRFSRNTSVPSQPTVKDKDTGLIWQGCAAGLSGNDCAGTATTKNWDDAISYCADLNTQGWGGYSMGWHLPTQPSSDLATGELSSIVLLPCPASPSQGNACIDNSAFPNTPANYFGSSSSYADYAWFVDFGLGYVGYGFKSSVRYVRCVRSGP